MRQDRCFDPGQMFGVSDVLLDLFINRLKDLARPSNDLGPAPGVKVMP